MIFDERQAIDQARKVITERDGVIAFRTDTFYGLGADPFNRAALRRINELKGREGGKPILLVISDRSFAERFILDQSGAFAQVAEKHWPGPLTLVSKARSEVPEEITAGSGTVGVRLPDDAEVRDVVRKLGGALTATSANLAGQPPARTAREVFDYFPSLLDMILDGGEAAGGAPSTVLDLSGPTPRLVREGAVTRDELRKTLAGPGLELQSF